MAGQAHARPHEVIDLTSDNEEDNSDLQASRRPVANGNKAVENWREKNGYVNSNHGLPDPQEFQSVKSSSRKTRSTRDVAPAHMLGVEVGIFAKGKEKSRSAKGGYSSAVNTSRGEASSNDQAPILPGATIHSYQSSRLSNGADQRSYLSAGLPAATYPGRTPYTYTPAKQETSQAYTNGFVLSSNPPTPTYATDRSPLQLDTPRRAHNDVGSEGDKIGHNIPGYFVANEDERSRITYSPLNATAELSTLKRRKLDAVESQSRRSSSTHVATPLNNSNPMQKDYTPILPTSKTIIGGSSRFGESPLSKVPSERGDLELTAGKLELRTEMLNKQVVPHVKKATRRHRGQLGKTILTAIAQKVAEDLVNDPSFEQHLSENRGKLSSEFEQNLKRAAELRVANEVTKKTTLPVINASTAGDVLMSGLQPELPEQSYLTPTSAESPGSDEVFEHCQDLLKLPGIATDSRLRDDFSPATSFSNGRASSHNLSEDHDYGNEKQVQTVSYPSRTTRGASKRDYFPWKKTRAPRTSQKLKMKSSSTHVREESDGRGGTDDSIVITESIRASALSKAKMQLMLRQRERDGMVPVRLRCGQTSYQTMATNAFEDSMIRDYQWGSQSGDPVTITWTGENTFVSGALTHYDVHNMQYNRSGNLVVGSTNSRIVKMIDGHRTVRPKVTTEENKENALPAMRATQDEWRYAPVVSSAYCALNDHTFTASYDRTVKIWKVSESEKGPSMELQGIWEHDFFVNFVVTSLHHDMVATAGEAHNDAVRVYKFDETDVSRSAYDVYNANKAQLRPGDLRMADNWAYHPATMQWGKSDKVSNLLLVGYSPRAATNYDDAIPESKRNSGELCCWNVNTGEQIPINAGKTHNVFEVIWHPTQPIFLVANSPAGTYDTKKTKTQVRLYQLQGIEFESFQCMRTLDCPAADINELTIMPTSTYGGYVTASCTDGKTYVWDTMDENRVLHVLSHGESIDNPDPDLPLEQADSGVKFAAWGQSTNRFYTGSSDGVVKVWDLTRPPQQTFLRDILQAPGGIACGIFSSDFSQLLIGDATGHLHLIRRSDDDDDADADDPKADEEERNRERNRDALKLPLKRRKPILRHPDPPSPPKTIKDSILLEGFPLPFDPASMSTYELCHRYLNDGILRYFPINIPGYGIRQIVGQGPNYSELGLYRRDLHVNGNPLFPRIPNVRNNSHWNGITRTTSRFQSFPVLLPVASSRKRTQHQIEELDLEELIISEESEEFEKDVATCADCVLNMEEEGRDFVVDEDFDFSEDDGLDSVKDEGRHNVEDE